MVGPWDGAGLPQPEFISEYDRVIAGWQHGQMAFAFFGTHSFCRGGKPRGLVFDGDACVSVRLQGTAAVPVSAPQIPLSSFSPHSLSS